MAVVADELSAFRTSRTPAVLRVPLDFGKRKPVSAVAGIVVIFACAMALTAPWLAPYGPDAPSLIDRLKSPSGGHWFGTDQFGRDVLTRVMYGGRTSLAVGLGATALGVSMGVLFGLLSGYASGLLDLVIQRLMDAVMALPPIILLMVLSTTLSPSLRNVIIAISILVTPGAARVVRSATLSVKEMPYIEAARSTGATAPRIVFRHILPNVMAPIIVIGSITVGSVIIIEAALGFLGLSVRPPTSTWGNMLNTGAQTYMESAPWLVLAPGAAIALTVFSINLLGDGLRDVLDPRQRGR